MKNIISDNIENRYPPKSSGFLLQNNKSVVQYIYKYNIIFKTIFPRNLLAPGIFYIDSNHERDILRRYNDMKEIWYGFDKNGNVVETFFGTYAEAVDYFNSEESSPRVESFDWSKHK